MLLVPLTLLAIYLLTLHIGRPLRQIDRAISDLGHGRLHQGINVNGPHDLERLGGGDAPSADELDLEPAPLHLLGDLRPRAVDDADGVAGRAQLRDGVGDTRGRGPSHLQDDCHVR